MSKASLGQVVKRAISDAAFRRQLRSDPEGALKGFDLTSAERAALRSGDASKLSTFGVDQRMSKAFMGDGAGAASRAGSKTALSESSDARTAFIDQGSSASNVRIDDAGGPRASLTDAERLGQVNAAFEGGDSAAGGRSALGDQHDLGRAAIGDNAGGSLGSEQHAVVSSDGRDPYLSARDPGTGEFVRDIGTGEPFTATAAPPLGPEQHAVVSSDGRDPYLSARDPGTGEFVRDIGTGEAIGASGAQSSLGISGQTRDTSASIDAASGREGDAFMTADEMGNDVAASGSGHPSLSADQRLAGETLEADITPADPAADSWVENPERHA